MYDLRMIPSPAVRVAMLQEKLHQLQRDMCICLAAPLLSSWHNAAILLQLGASGFRKSQMMAQFPPGTLLPAPFGQLSKGAEETQVLQGQALGVSRLSASLVLLGNIREKQELQHLQISCFTACAWGRTTCALGRRSVQARSS